MTLPFLFATASSATGADLDEDFAAIGACSIIPCVISGTNALVFTPGADTPSIPALANYMQFSGIATAANTAAVVASINGLTALSVYKDTSGGPVLLSGGEITVANVVTLIYDSALNSGAGGFHLAILPAGGSGTVTGIVFQAPLTAATVTSAGTVSMQPIVSGDIIGNSGTATAVPTGVTMTALLDRNLSATQGAILYRGSSVWTALAPGTAGQQLTTGGGSANPSWASATAPAQTISRTLTATGTSQTTGLVLTSQNNEVTTTPSGTGVVLWATLGIPIYVWNRGALTLNVYPPSGCQIDAAGTNVAVTLAANAKGNYTLVAATQAYQN